jgi:hypothetical protein
MKVPAVFTSGDRVASRRYPGMFTFEGAEPWSGLARLRHEDGRVLLSSVSELEHAAANDEASQ